VTTQLTSLNSQSSIYSVVANLMALERRPITRLETTRGDLQTLRGVYADLKTKLTALRSASEDLADTIDRPLAARSVASSDADVVTATATAAAALGAHQVFVSQLAKHHTMVSDQFTSTGTSLRTAVGTGDKTFSITVNGTTTNVTVTIGASDTDEDIISATAAAINAAMADLDDSVTATALQDTSSTHKLVLRSDSTGVTYKMDLADVTGTLLQTLGIDDESVAATGTTGGYIYADSELTAEFTVDGVSVSRDSNVLDDVIAGMTITLHAAQSVGDPAVDLTVNPDQSAIRSAVDDFITKYNDVVEYLRAKTAVDLETGERQALGGKYIYLQLLSDLRSTVAGIVSTGSSDVQMLSDIGIAQASDGTLSISDDDEFNQALESDPDAVEALFNSTTDGIAVLVEDLLEPFVDTGGYLDTETSNIDRKVSSIDERIERLEARAAIREQQLIAQYSRLQEAMVILSRQQAMINSFLQFYTGQSAY